MDSSAAFGYASLGGIAVELLGWWRIREEKKRPHFAKSAAYWVPTVFMVLIGGVLPIAYLESGCSLTPILAFHLGASAPILIGNLAKGSPKIAGSE